MKFIEFLYSLKNDNNSSLIESIGLGYNILFESKVDFEKYSLINKRVDALIPKIVDYYTGFLKEDKRKSLYLQVGDISDKYNHLSEIPIIFTADIGDTASYMNIRYEKQIVVPIPSKVNDLFNEFKLDYLSEVKKLFPDVEEDVAYSYLSSPYNLSEYKFPDDGNLFESYMKLWKEYKEKIKLRVNRITRGILVHEIIHAIDDSMHPKTFDHNKDTKTKYQYFNLPEEINAYIVGLISELSDEDMDKSFNEIINTGKVKQYLTVLSPNNRKRALKRIYSIITDRLIAV